MRAYDSSFISTWDEEFYTWAEWLRYNHNQFFSKSIGLESSNYTQWWKKVSVNLFVRLFTTWLTLCFSFTGWRISQTIYRCSSRQPDNGVCISGLF